LTLQIKTLEATGTPPEQPGNVKTAPMDARTLFALKASIRKWGRLACQADCIEVNIWAESCPLCAIYNPKDNPVESPMCVGCPVMNSTGKDECRGSPWGRASGELWTWRDNKSGHGRDAFHAAARDMADFLRTLLPAGEVVS
jgi:hypothetical protein